MRRYRIPPQHHSAVESYFTGLANDPLISQELRDHVRRGELDEAHAKTKEYGLLQRDNQYGDSERFPLGDFLRNIERKQHQDHPLQSLRRAIASIEKGENYESPSVNVPKRSLRHVANGNLHKLPEEDINHIVESIARRGMNRSDTFDVSDLIGNAKREIGKQKRASFERSYRKLQYGLNKAMKGTDRDPEKQRQQDMNTNFFRKPKTYSGQHPDHDIILKYFDHFSREVSPDARLNIMHDARIGEYGSAQRKLARRVDRLPAGLDGLKFGDHQIEMIQSMGDQGIFD